MLLPIDLSTHIFCTARPAILTKDDLPKFKASVSLIEISGFISNLQKSVEGKSCADIPTSYKLKPVEDVLEQVAAFTDSIELMPQLGHFANRAFRTLLRKIEESTKTFMEQILVTEPYLKAAIELKSYFINSFGNYERLEYGTAHELNFLMFLYLLYRINYYCKEQFNSLVGHTFAKYIKCIQKLIYTYNINLAISSNAWGLDTYHFLPFIFGASQLIGNETMTPKTILKEVKGYLYLDYIYFIMNINKNKSLSEAIPALTVITNVPTWNEVAKGLIKMYQGEVLNKYKIVKNLLFGSVLLFSNK